MARLTTLILIFMVLSGCVYTSDNYFCKSAPEDWKRVEANVEYIEQLKLLEFIKPPEEMEQIESLVWHVNSNHTKYWACKPGKRGTYCEELGMLFSPEATDYSHPHGTQTPQTVIACASK